MFNASKKLENDCHMIALYAVRYNFARINSSIRVAPAMAAGLSNRLWSMSDIVTVIDAATPTPAKRGPYKRGNSN